MIHPGERVRRQQSAVERRQGMLRVMMCVCRDQSLPNVALALKTPRRLACCLHCRQHKSDQHHNYANRHQDFDQCHTAPQHCLTTLLRNASDQWLAATSSAIAHDAAASPLHRVVPGARPHGVGTPPRDDWILQGRRGGQPTRVARRPGPLAQATTAAWIYIAMLTPPASLPAPRRCFSPSAPHAWPSIGALADRRCPATISIYVAIRVEAARSGSYSGYLDLVASLEAWNH